MRTLQVVPLETRLDELSKFGALAENCAALLHSLRTKELLLENFFGVVEGRHTRHNLHRDRYFICLAVEGEHASDELESDAANSPHVGLIRQSAVEQLRGHEPERALGFAREIPCTVHLVRNTEIAQFDFLMIFRQKYVLRF